MTQPGFTSGDDFVAARVSIDVPTEGLQSLKEMSNGINNFRTSVEAATRSSASFVSYIQQMVQVGNQATEAHRNLASQLERNADLQQRAMGGGGSAQSMLPVSRMAPQGFVDNFSGMGIGMGSGRAPTTPQNVPASNYQDQTIDPTRQLDPRAYINAQAGRHRVLGTDFSTTSTGAPDMQATADRIESRDKQQRTQADNGPSPQGSSGPSRPSGLGGGLARNVMSEMSMGGGSHLGMAQLGLKGMQAIAGMGGGRDASAGPGASGTAVAQAAQQMGAAGAEEAASGGMLSAVGRFAGPIGMGLAGLGAVEKGGAMYQGYKNLGNIRGGGAGEGMASEMAMRTMAMNPFLSTEQSRQIIMAGLTEGYSGKQFDTVTQFMASNLKDMNIQVSDTVQLLRKNVAEGGQSVTGLAASLGMIKEMSKSGYLSNPDMQRMFEQGTSQMVSNGFGGPDSSMAMTQAMGGFSDNKSLAGLWPQMVQNTASTPQQSAMLQQFSGIHVPGLDPTMLPLYMQAHGMNANDLSGKALDGLVKKLFHGMKYDPGNTQFLNVVGIFRREAAMTFGVQLDPNQALQMVQQVLGGNNPATQGAEKRQQAASEVNGGAGPGTFMEGFGALGTSIMDVGKMFAAGVTGNDQAAVNAADDMGRSWDNAAYHNRARASNPVLDSIIGQYGASSIEVLDSSGKASSPDGSRAQVQGLASGQLKWRRKGDTGGGVTLAQTPEQPDQAFRTGGTAQSQTNVSFQPAQVQISFGPNGQMTASPNPIRLTPNQVAVNSGAGSNTLNNPPPGDGFGYVPGRSVGSH
jgi:hypothetical protein